MIWSLAAIGQFNISLEVLASGGLGSPEGVSVEIIIQKYVGKSLIVTDVLNHLGFEMLLTIILSYLANV